MQDKSHQHKPDSMPDTPDYEAIKIIGTGSYGEVWLVRSLTDQYYAAKIVRRERFMSDKPFEREFNGILKFEPVSRTHPSQVDILHVGRGEGFFYYIMELADDVFTGRDIQPDHYTAHTLSGDLLEKGRLPAGDCIHYGMALTTALQHLHLNGLVHRDVKPSNIIFVDDKPKLADIGLVSSTDATMSIVGTEGFIPPEGPGTPQADIYSLGKVLYEASTGMDRSHFPELPTQVAEFEDGNLFRELNAVIAKACRSQADERYASAEAMQTDLLMISEGRSVRRSQILEKQIARLKQAAVVLVLLSILVGVAWIYQSGQTTKMAELAQTNEALANQKADLAETTAELAQQMQRQVLGLQMQKGISYMEEEDYMMSLLWLTKALENVEPGSEEDRIHRIRIQHLLRRLPRLEQVFIGDNGKTGSTTLSPDGKTVVTSGAMGGVIEFWDVATGERLGDPLISKDEWIKTITFQNEGTRLLCTGDSWVELWDVATRKRIVSFKDSNLPYFWTYSDHFAITRYNNGRTYIDAWNLATGERTIDSKSISTPHSDIRQTNGQTNIRVSKDGNTLLFTAFGCPIHLINPTDGKEMRPPINLKDRTILDASFYKTTHNIIALTKESPDGNPLKKGIIHISLIDGLEGQLLKDFHTFNTPVVEAQLHVSRSGNEALYVSDVEDAYLRFVQDDTLAMEVKIDYRPLVVHFQKDGTGFYAKVPKKELELRSIINRRMETSFAISRTDWIVASDHNLFLTDNKDLSTKSWSFPQTSSSKHVYQDIRRQRDTHVKYNTSGNKLIISGSRFAGSYESGQKPVLDLSWEHPGGRHLPMSLTMNRDKASFVLKEDYSVPRGSILNHSDIQSNFHYFSTDANLPLASKEYQGFLEFFRFTKISNQFAGILHDIKDPKDRSDGPFGKAYLARWEYSKGEIGKKSKLPLPEQGKRQGYQMSPLGSYIAVPNMKRLSLIDTVSGTELWSSKFKTMIISTAFSSDESLLAISVSEQFFLLDTRTGKPIGTPFMNRNFPVNFTFNTSGDRLVHTTLNSEDIRLFQLTPEPQLITAIETPDLGTNRKMLFSPDGTMLLALFDKGAQLYSAKTGWPIMPLLHSGEPLHPDDELNVWNHSALHADFHPETSEFAVAFGDYATTSFDLLPNSWPVEDLQTYAQAMVGLDIDQDDKERPIYGKEVKNRFQKIKARHPEFWKNTTRNTIDWHLTKAAQCEENQLPDGVRLHLERIASFENAVDADPLSIIEAQLALGAYDQAEKNLQKQLDIATDKSRITALLALTLTQQGKKSEARSIMTPMINQLSLNHDSELLIELTLLSILYPEAVDFRSQLIDSNLKAGPDPQLAEYLAWLYGLEKDSENAEDILRPFLISRRGAVQRKGMVLALCLAAYHQGNMPLAREYAYIYGSPEFPQPTSPTVDWQETMALKQMEQHITNLLDINLDTYGMHTPPPLTFLPRDPECGPQQVDLSEHFNFSFVENVSRGRRSSELCSLSELPTGLVQLGGVDFDVRAGIQLNGRSFDENRRMQKKIFDVHQAPYPDEIPDIRIDQYAERLHFLHAGQGMFDKNAGAYVIHYEDETTQEIPLIVGENTGDWWRRLSEDHPNHTPKNVWEGNTPAANYGGQGVRLIKLTWENPHPEKKIKSFDFTSSNHDAAPFLIAITAEQ